jgi:hypothetical protein
VTSFRSKHVAYLDIGTVLSIEGSCVKPDAIVPVHSACLVTALSRPTATTCDTTLVECNLT